MERTKEGISSSSSRTSDDVHRLLSMLTDYELQRVKVDAVLKVKRKIEKEHVYANVMKKEVKVNRE
jgi:hypothetical protein